MDMPEIVYLQRHEYDRTEYWIGKENNTEFSRKYIRADLVEQAMKALEYARLGFEAFQSEIDELCEECGMNPAAANQFCDDRIFVIDEALSKLESKQ